MDELLQVAAQVPSKWRRVLEGVRRVLLDLANEGIRETTHLVERAAQRVNLRVLCHLVVGVFGCVVGS